MCKVMEDMRYESLQEGLKAGREEGMKAGIEKGMKTGRAEGMKAAALRMLEAGKYALDEIMAISGLSAEEVKKLNACRLS